MSSQGQISPIHECGAGTARTAWSTWTAVRQIDATGQAGPVAALAQRPRGGRYRSRGMPDSVRGWNCGTMPQLRHSRPKHPSARHAASPHDVPPSRTMAEFRDITHGHRSRNRLTSQIQPSAPPGHGHVNLVTHSSQWQLTHHSGAGKCPPAEHAELRRRSLRTAGKTTCRSVRRGRPGARVAEHGPPRGHGGVRGARCSRRGQAPPPVAGGGRALPCWRV